MIDWLAHRVRATPDATAVIDADTEWSYADLDAAVDDLAGRLAALGFESGDHLGTVLETRPSSVRLVHAAARLGCVLVPLSARLTSGELESRIERADLAGLICGADTETATLDAAGDLPVASADPSTAVTTLHESDLAAFESPQQRLHDPQVMLSTSGTTGTPKLVVLTGRNLLASAVASAFRLGVSPGDRWLDPLSIYHMGGIAPVVRTTIYGATLVIGDTREGFDPAATRRALAEYDCTGVSLVPTMLDRMLDADTEADSSTDSSGEPSADASHGLSESLRFVLLGGAPASEELIERCGECGVPVCPSYGMTETDSQAATARPEEAIAHPGTVGRALVGTTVSILDGAGDSVAPGETGEIVVSGPTVTPGYYRDQEATDAAFSEEGFHTGDLGHRDQGGRLWVTGRRDDRILTGGETVDPAEIRATLCDHPKVCDAAVVGLPDEEYGERVGALVVAGELDATAIEDHCRERLAGFKLPRTVAFTGELPRTASGTIERTAVRKRLCE